MSVYSLLKGHFAEGGPLFMTLLCIMWILVFFYSIRFIKNYRSTDRDYKTLEKFNSIIIFIGGFGFLFSLFHRTMGIYGALSALEITSDISPTLVASGFKASLVAPLHSLFLFLVTSIIWFIFRNKIKSELFV